MLLSAIAIATQEKRKFIGQALVHIISLRRHPLLNVWLKLGDNEGCYIRPKGDIKEKCCEIQWI
jgi:hypothetical protein